MYELVLEIARLRVQRIGLNATAAAAGLDKAQLSRWLSTGDTHRELRADAFCRLAESLGVSAFWDGFPAGEEQHGRARRVSGVGRNSPGG